MMIDADDRDRVPLQKRWIRIGVILSVLSAVATILAIILLRIDQSIAIVVISTGSILGGWLLVFYFAYVFE